LYNGPVLQAFHVTDEISSVNIWNHHFQCGSKGILGPGMYFCPRPLDCFRKIADQTKKNTIMIEVDLYMGHSFVTELAFTNEIAKTFIQETLTEYDSFIYNRNTGIEYVVYRPFQIRIKAMYRIYKSRIQLHSDYILGGWSFQSKPIRSLRDLGPYDLNSIKEKNEILGRKSKKKMKKRMEYKSR
jgi:hypothetical protein